MSAEPCWFESAILFDIPQSLSLLKPRKIIISLDSKTPPEYVAVRGVMYVKQLCYGKVGIPQLFIIIWSNNILNC